MFIQNLNGNSMKKNGNNNVPHAKG
ncbi:pilus assembly protein PilX, partial [Salmonella enterica]|nr:pilus assembly protein PilX [Salmonella enterica]